MVVTTPCLANRLLVFQSEKRTLLFKDQSSLPGPLLKMAVNPSSEIKAILKFTPDLTTALSNESLRVANELLSKGLISSEVYSKVLMPAYFLLCS